MENRPPTSTPATPDEIRRQMNTIRSSLGGDVQRIVSNAQELTDWRHYVRAFPWGSLGVAGLLGYLVVPQKVKVIRPDKETLAELAKENRLVVHAASDMRPKPGVAASLATLAGNMLLRAGIAYLGQQSGKIFGEQAAAKTPSHEATHP